MLTSIENIIDCLLTNSINDIDGVSKQISGLKATLLEVGPVGSTVGLNDAKRLWNAAVAYSQSDIDLDIKKAKLIASCRELSYHAMQQLLRPPWDDQTLLDFFEMNLRLSKCFNEISDSGKVRLYLSKATDFREQLKKEVVLPLKLQEQFNNADCSFYVEKIRSELNGSDTTLTDHTLLEGLESIQPQYLPHYVSELIHAFSGLSSNSKQPIALLEKILDHIRPLESFPAHISDDLIYALLDSILISGTKASIERATGLFEKISLHSPLYYRSLLKYNLIVGSPFEELQSGLIACAKSSSSILLILKMIEDAKGTEIANQCFEKLLASDLNQFSKEIQSEIVEFNTLNLLKYNRGTLNDYLSENLGILSDESIMRLRNELALQANSLLNFKNYERALTSLRCSLMLLSEERNAKDVQKTKACVAYCLIQQRKLDEAEELILGLPMDLDGLKLRFSLAVHLRNEIDASNFLDRIQNLSAVKIDDLLGLANVCQEVSMNNILLKVLTTIAKLFSNEQTSESLKLNIIRNAMIITIQSLHDCDQEEKLSILIAFYEKILPMLVNEEEPDNFQFYFELAWNSGIQASNLKIYNYACFFFNTSHKILCLGPWKNSSDLIQGKLCTLVSFLENASCIKEPSDLISSSFNDKIGILKQAEDLLDDAILSSTYLPSSTKRQKLEGTLQLRLPSIVDSLKIAKIVGILSFKINLMESRYKEALTCLSELSKSTGTEDILSVLVWVMDRRDRIDSSAILSLLEVVVAQIAEAPTNSLDLIKFSFVYRGMAMVALTTSRSALKYFEQALKIVKMYPEYPKEEICWLAITSYNHAMGLSKISADEALNWCELSLSLCHHTGQYRQCYESSIRAGYSKILERL